MTLEEKVGKTLAELGVSDAQGVESLFAGVRAAMEREREALITQAPSEGEREATCKALRDRWLAPRFWFSPFEWIVLPSRRSRRL